MNENLEMNRQSAISFGKKPSFIGMLYNPVEQMHRLKTEFPVLRPLMLILVLYSLFTGLTNYFFADEKVIQEASEVVGVEPDRINLVLSLIIALTNVLNIFFMIVVLSILFKICLIFFQKDVPFKKILSFTTYTNIIPVFFGFLSLSLNLLMGNSTFYSFTNFGGIFLEGSLQNIIFSTLDLSLILNFILLGLGLFYVAELGKVQTVLTISFFFICNCLANIFMQLIKI
ncbi:YIP1 family protein [Bacillus sp. FJAT-47783]|uniref:YIP1 family protein n=1 Tax=Bacillus sp. FJAT-47783 TaxID=2922712 RepID=UPI001FACA178|nr:YIP1 family protein [Bacillus sp. FJAT-47783]